MLLGISVSAHSCSVSSRPKRTFFHMRRNTLHPFSGSAARCVVVGAVYFFALE
jgi:hypothetical protein